MTIPRNTSLADATPAEQEEGGPEELGARERAKRDKQRRIAAAARQVIIDKGYEAATTREIAAEAGVSIGTVFVYARDKRDLLLMVVNDELDALTEQGQAWVERAGPLLERLCGFFGERYRYWVAEPALSRPALGQTYELPEGAEAEELASEQVRRFQQRRDIMLSQLRTMVLQAQASGEAAADLDPQRVAALFMSLYVGEVRRWLQHPQPDASAGMKQLRAMLAVVMRGVSARD
ncbi:MAG TPA: helix-turn-helix domain-containing protein [Ramlibacter sp.]|jgi:AcrR family transcriptional regulator|nr:helix-turn-helix domain-containing protein [Ramlibacter sp.]